MAIGARDRANDHWPNCFSYRPDGLERLTPAVRAAGVFYFEGAAHSLTHSMYLNRFIKFNKQNIDKKVVYALRASHIPPLVNRVCF